MPCSGRATKALCGGQYHLDLSSAASVFPNDFQISFALQRANQPALACIKISILLFYLRIFGQNKNFRMATYINMAYTIGWAISTWIVNLTVCTPIAFYYDRTIKGGTCKNQAISGSVNGGLSLFGDILILILPVPMVWNLKMNSRRKIGICGIFMLGCLYVFLLLPTRRHWNVQHD